MAITRMWKHDEFLETGLAMLLLIAVSGPGFRALSVTPALGINYGMIADNLPAPAEVVSLMQSISISKAKLYDTNPLVLKTFRNTGISFLVAVANEDLAGLSNLGVATTWVEQNILAYYPDTNIIGIVVGNEILSGSITAQMSQILPAMKNIYSVLSTLNFQNEIMVSTAHNFAVLSSSYPPSAGAFNASIASTYMKPILQFLSQTGAPFMINAYPYFAYKEAPNTVSLDYVLFQSNSGVLDATTGLRYYNMFDAQLDAVYSAISALVDYQNISLLVSETGWPSAGDSDEPGASVQNAQVYHANLFQHLSSNQGTPLRPNTSMDVYLFALFNEDLKPGPTSERHYGLFQPDGTKVYSFDFSESSSSVDHHRVHWALNAGCILFACLCLLKSMMVLMS